MAYISRADWGAGPHRAGVIQLPVSRFFLHHTVTPFWVGADAARRVRDIARSRGFVDISYSELVDRQGNEIEGRGWGRQGGHTSGYNSTSHALSLIGNLDAAGVPDGMIRGAARATRRHGAVGPRRITHGHRDVGATACPGRYAYAQISAINVAASGTPTPPGGTMSLTAAEVRKIVREELDDIRTARHVKAFGRNYIRDNVLPLLSQDRLTLIGIVAGRYVRDENPDRPVDLDELATQITVALVEALPAALSELTPDTIASAVVDALPEELAQQVVDELAAQLNRER